MGSAGSQHGQRVQPAAGLCAVVDAVLQRDLFPPEPVWFESALERPSPGCRLALSCDCKLHLGWVREKERQSHLPVSCNTFPAGGFTSFSLFNGPQPLLSSLTPTPSPWKHFLLTPVLSRQHLAALPASLSQIFLHYQPPE